MIGFLLASIVRNHNIYFVLATVLLVSASGCGKAGLSDSAVDQWVRTEHPAGGFAIAIPTLTDTTDTQSHVRMLGIDAISSDDTKIMVTASYGLKKKEGDKFWFRILGIPYETRVGVVRSEIEYMGHPCLKFEGSYEDFNGKKVWMSARVFAIENDTFTILVTNPNNQAMTAEQLAKFFDSFEVLELKD